MSTDTTLSQFIRALPKAELHVHVEGTLEPDMALALAERNGVRLPYESVEALRKAYRFTDLQSFLDVYYLAAQVLRTEQDFYDLAWAYLNRAKRDGVRRAEVFFDPQTHTARGVPFETVIAGLGRAMRDGEARLGVSAALIMCILRHLSAGDAMATLETALPYRSQFIGVGLDSSEIGNPPGAFRAVFERARAEGLHTVAHAGEEGPPSYVWEALDILGVQRIDHGVRSLEDRHLVDRLRGERVPLTVCPLSNVKLKVFPSLAEHNLPQLLENDLLVSLNADDPAYFGGYVGDVYEAVQETFGLDAEALRNLAKNSVESSFLDEASKRRLLREIDAAPAPH